MLKINPEIWTRNGREQFVVLSMGDFEKVQEALLQNSRRMFALP